jgi:tetratricopeptide (TPR) repeat protein
MKDQSEDFADQLGRYLLRVGFKQQELANKIGMHRNTIVKWMNRTSWPTSRGQVLRVADELSLLKEERKALIQAAGFSLERWPTEVWMVPQQRDMFFTGRDDVFQSLREVLAPGSMAALTQAISGLGGMGKTHTVIEYAYRFHKSYEAVLWLQADSWEILVSECMKLTDILELPEQKETDQVIIEIQRWLRKHRHWLLILDNVENPQEILPKFVPTSHQGYVLVTTRIHNIEPVAQTQVLATMSEQEGVLFLLRRTKRIAISAGLEQTNSAQRDEARQIWQLVDGLPLALDQAGAYILETSCSFSAYQEQYNRRRADLLQRRGKRFIGHEMSVATTFSLALEQVEKIRPMAADILRACSLLYNEAIAEEIFLDGATHLYPHLIISPYDWDEAVGTLLDYSLVQRNTEERTLNMHRVVQAVLQDAMQTSEQEVWVDRVIKAVKTVFPDADHITRNQCERLLPHALACISRMPSDKNTSTDLASLLFKTASYLHDRARYTEAEPLLQRALSIYEQTLGSNHLLVASLLNNLALLYVEQNQYEQAESLFEKALLIWVDILGDLHPQVADALSNLAFLYFGQGNYKQAELLLQHSLRIYEQTLGPGHHRVATSLSNLATFYSDRSEYEQAELLYRNAQSIWEQTPSSDHPHKASLLYGLACLYLKKGTDVKEEPLFQQALHLREETLETGHPDVAPPLYGLIILSLKQERYAEAERLTRHALHIQEQILKPKDLDIAALLFVLSTLLSMQGKYVEAEPLYQRALSIQETMLGYDHPTTMRTRELSVAMLRLMGM